MVGQGGIPSLSIDRAELLAHARALFAILGDRTNPQRAGDAARHALDALDRALVEQGPPSFALACRRGCSYCCHNWVTATAPEIFLLARTIRAIGGAGAESIIARIRHGAALPGGGDRAARLASGEACALLADDLCRAYEGRPLICRAYASSSLEACIAAFDGKTTSIPMPTTHILLRGRYAQCLWAALAAAGYSDRSYELSQALARVIEDPAAEARWLAGEELFAGVAADAERDPAGMTIVRGLVEDLLRAA